MFGLASIKLIAAAGLGVLIALGAGYGWGRLDGKALTKAAIERALRKAEKSTEDAINELAEEADRARMRRRICLGSGGVWSFANNKCVKTETEPDGSADRRNVPDRS